MKKRMVLSLVLGVLLVLATLSSAFAGHTPAPEFPHPGKAEQCELTNPHQLENTFPPAVFEQLHTTWHTDCEHDLAD